MASIVWHVFRPGNLVLIVLCLGAVLLFGRFRDLGKKLILGSACFMLLIAVLPVGEWLLIPLENRFPVPQRFSSRIDGIMMLGGTFDTRLIKARRQLVLHDTGERIFAFSDLAKQFPQARLVFAGGLGSLGPDGIGDVLPAEVFFAGLGIDPGRVILEQNARNTRENAIFTHGIIKPEKAEQWIIVTSAWHMPRAVGLFRKAGWSVLPYPVDFRTDGNYKLDLRFDLQTGMSLFQLGLREWAALIAQRGRGWSDELFPAEHAGIPPGS